MNKDKNNNEEIEDIIEHEAALNEAEETPECFGELDAEIAAHDDLEALRLENQHLKDEYLRALAESENIKRRCAQEIEKNNKYAVSSFAKSLLSVADNLHRAIAASEGNQENCQDLLKGIEMTEAELMKVFNKHGITKMEILNTVFDPNYHQVIQEVEDADKPTGTIINELQTGYMINDRILREAMVIVTKGGK